MNDALEEIPLARLKPHARNARTHGRKQLRMIANSIEKFGFLAPVLIDADNVILAGHARVEAAKLIGRKSVPCRRISHLNEEDKRAYIFADNQLALKAGWDRDVLALELQDFVDLGFDLTVIGFEPAEVDAALGAHAEAQGKDGALRPRRQCRPEEPRSQRLSRLDPRSRRLGGQRRYILAMEGRWKAKLQSREMGLNRN